MTEPANMPTVFNDSIELRARALRFRGIGNPYSFLDGIGIVPIKEFLFRGANIIDLADALNIPITIINNWIDKNNYFNEIEDASRLSAEGYIYRGERLLHAAESKFQLDKAKAMLEHGRFMASKKDRKQYGNTNEQASGAGVTYIFNIGKPPEEPPARVIEAQEALDAEFTEVKQVAIAMDFNLGEKPSHLMKKHSTPAVKPVEPDKEHYAEQDRWDT